MLDGHADIEQDILTFFMIDDLAKDLPAVLVQVKLEEVIKTAIAGDLKLRSYTQASSSFLCDDN